MTTNRLRQIIYSTIILFSILLSLGGQPHWVQAAGPWYVRTDGNNANDCLSPASACATINAAIQKAAPADTIYVAAGVYTSIYAQVVLINKDIHLSGGWDNTFYFQNGQTIIDGELTTTGITVNSNNNVTIDHFNIENYQSGYGFTDDGYGIRIDDYSNVTLTDSTIRNYYTGIENWGHLILDHCTISHNSMYGILNYHALEINDSTIYKNSSLSVGGGIMSNGENLSINNSTISFNKAGTNGGGIYSNTYPVIIHSSTITGNSAKNGGGIFGTNITSENSIISGNQAETGLDCYGQIQSAGYNIIGVNSGCSLLTTTGDLQNIDPLIGPMMGKPDSPMYHPLLSNSPAIDAGNPSGCNGSNGLLETDQRGAPRSGRCDIGAYEYVLPGEPASVVILQGSPQHATPLSPYRIPFQAAVLDSIGSPVIGEPVTFTAPADGPSGIFFDSGTGEEIEETAENGIAAPSEFTSNENIGDFQLAASVSDVAMPAWFELSNTEGLYVSPAGDDHGGCLHPAQTCASINIAIRKAIPGDKVFVSEGLYTWEKGSRPVVDVDRELNFSGGWDSTFTFQNGFTIIDGSYRIPGILVLDVTATVERFIVQNCPYNMGAGAIMNNGNLTLDQVVVRNNPAIGIRNTKILSVNNSSIVHNEYEGIWTWGSAVNPGSLIVSNSGIIDNHFAGIAQLGVLEANPIHIQNSIIARNTGKQCSGQIISSGYNLISDTTGCNFISSTGDLVNINDGLAAAMVEPGFFPFTPTSPEYNAGNPTGCLDNDGNPLNFDLRGMPRYGRCDIGPYEFHPIDLFTFTVDPEIIDGGETSMYTIAMPNLTQDLLQVSIFDDIPPEVDYVPGTLTATSGLAAFADGEVTWAGDIAAGEEVVVSFIVKGTHPAMTTNTAAVTIGENTFLLSVNLQINPYHLMLPYISKQP